MAYFDNLDICGPSTKISDSEVEKYEKERLGIYTPQILKVNSIEDVVTLGKFALIDRKFSKLKKLKASQPPRKEIVEFDK